MKWKKMIDHLERGEKKNIRIKQALKQNKSRRTSASSHPSSIHHGGELLHLLLLGVLLVLRRDLLLQSLTSSAW